MLGELSAKGWWTVQGLKRSRQKWVTPELERFVKVYSLLLLQTRELV